MCWQMKNIYQIILELTSRKISDGKFQLLQIAPCGENYKQRWTYSVRKSQRNKDTCWETITA